MQTLFQERQGRDDDQRPWTVSAVEGAKGFGGLDNLGVAPVPAGSAGQGAPVGGHNYVIYSGMDEDKAQAAIAFVKFMTSADSEAFTADKLGTLPTVKSAYAKVRPTRRSPMWQDGDEGRAPAPVDPRGWPVLRACST